MGVGHVSRENTPKTASKHTKHARKHNATHCKIFQNEQQHDMTIIVGRGGQCMSMVGIYGWQCVCRDLRTWWDTEMRLGGGTGGRGGKGFGHADRAKCTQTIRHITGCRWTQQSQLRTWGIWKSLKGQIKRDKRGERGGNQVTHQHEHNKKPKDRPTYMCISTRQNCVE